MDREFSTLSLGTAGSEDDREDYRALDERTKRQAATEYALNLCKQMEVLEQMLALPHNHQHFCSVFGGTIMMEFISLLNRDTFSMADVVEYSEGLQDHILKKYPEYKTRIEPARAFNRKSFHMQLARLWGQLDHSTQEKLSKGTPISTVIGELFQELVNINKSWNKMPATFVFPST